MPIQQQWHLVFDLREMQNTANAVLCLGKKFCIDVVVCPNEGVRRLEGIDFNKKAIFMHGCNLRLGVGG